jgi:hypothetical protein
MAWRIVKQPDGLLARFSEVVDNFTAVNMTEQEAVEECQLRGLSLAEAKEKVRRGIEDEPVRGFVERTANDGLDRWRDALETI